MLAFLIGHLVIFAPDIANRLLNWSDLLEDVPKGVITHFGFQANLTGQLVPVPPEDYAGRSIPTIPATIEDSTGNVLSTIEYRKWQDGGIILLTGKLPLDGLLIFLQNVRPEYLRVIKRPQLQISPLLPLTRGQFGEFLKNIEGRSNLRVNTQPPQGFVIQKIMDEGTSTPFIARCTLGLRRTHSLPAAHAAGPLDQAVPPAPSFISEKHWFGVSNPALDGVFGTLHGPEAAEKSPTTRKLY